MFNRKSARRAFAALIALGAMAAGSAHAGSAQWSVSVNLPFPPVPVVHVPAPVYHPPMPVPAPVVVYRPAPPPVVVYRPVPVADYRGWDHRHHHHHRYHRHHGHHHRHDHRDDHRDWRGDRGHDDDRGGRWEPGPRHRHH